MMATARTYHARSPRYVYRPDDQSFLRFAGMDTRGLAWHAQIRDLSESGLSFALGEATPPSEGDMLKLEFAIPGPRQIACFATVVRVEEKKEWDADWGDRGFTVVALQFRHLPQLHRRAIKKSLQGRVDPDEESNWDQIRHTHVIMLAATSLSMICILSAMTLPFEYWLMPFRALF